MRANPWVHRRLGACNSHSCKVLPRPAYHTTKIGKAVERPVSGCRPGFFAGVSHVHRYAPGAISRAEPVWAPFGPEREVDRPKREAARALVRRAGDPGG